MCSIARDMTTSIGGALSPASTLLGSTSITGAAKAGATSVARGRPAGTLLTGPEPTPPTRKLPPKRPPLEP